MFLRALKRNNEFTRALRFKPRASRDPGSVARSSWLDAGHPVPTAFQSLLLGKVWIGLHFQNLLGVPLAVCCDIEDPLVAIQLLVQRAVDRVVSQVGRPGQKVLCRCAGFDEMLQGAFGRTEAVGGFQRLRSLY